VEIRLKKEVGIFATNLDNETKCMYINANKWKKYVETCISTANTICEVNPEHSRWKTHGIPWRICHVMELSSVS
jgi:hypothetical protein